MATPASPSTHTVFNHWTKLYHYHLLSLPDRNTSDLKVLLAAIRAIVGFHKSGLEPMSESWLMDRTGLSPNAVRSGIRTLCAQTWLRRVDYCGPDGTARYQLPIQNAAFKKKLIDTTPTGWRRDLRLWHQSGTTDAPELLWFRMPNMFFTWMPDMNLSELKVTLVALYLFQQSSFKSVDTPVAMSNASLRQFTGLSRPSVKRGLQLACERGTLIKVDCDGSHGSTRYCPGWQNLIPEQRVCAASYPSDRGGNYVTGQASDPPEGKYLTPHGGKYLTPQKKVVKEKKKLGLAPASPDRSADAADLSECVDVSISQLPAPPPSDTTESTIRPQTIMACIWRHFPNVTFPETQQKRLLKATDDDGKSLDELAKTDRVFCIWLDQRLTALKKMLGHRGILPRVSSLISGLLNMTKENPQPAWQGWLVWKQQREADMQTGISTLASHQTTGSESTDPGLDHIFNNPLQ